MRVRDPKPQLDPANQRFWRLPNHSLKFIAKDAAEAARNLPDCPKPGVWVDQVNDACTVLNWRYMDTLESEANGAY